MLTLRRYLLVFIFLFGTVTLWAKENPWTNYVGEDLFNCARQVYGLDGKSALNQDLILDFFKVASKYNVEMQKFFIEPMSKTELALYNKVKRMPLAMVTRTSVESLRKILKAGGLHSPNYSADVKTTITPGFEDYLFGAYGCIFITVGPYEGTERYGEVEIKLRDGVKAKSWGTPWSGNYFLLNHRKIDKKELYETGKIYKNEVERKDVFMNYLNYIIVGDDWSDSLAIQAVMYLRNGKNADELELRVAEAKKLIEEVDEKRFWDRFINNTHCFGYIEGKAINYLPLSAIKYIKVPNHRYDEIMGWDEAASVKNLIK